ncbi:hypothetical protein [Brevundimonas sp. GCM10030266]|uniref:hypothetical protein n=1 Tax=Brevundimonas sp. GCM10030266 TaxID=3273386 RepID=UPI0036242337
MRPPISILVVVALWSVTGALAVAGWVARGEFPMAAFNAVYGAWAVIAMWRMSRWPLLVGLGLGVARQAWHVLVENGNYDQYPILGPWALIVPAVMIAALILPHWKRMNWSIIGSGRPERRVANVFG